MVKHNFYIFQIDPRANSNHVSGQCMTVTGPLQPENVNIRTKMSDNYVFVVFDEWHLSKYSFEFSYLKPIRSCVPLWKVAE